MLALLAQTLLAAVAHGAVAVPLLWIIGIILLIVGVVKLVRGGLLIGIVLIILGIILGGLNLI